MSATSTAEHTHPLHLRQMMVDCQIRTFDVTDQRVLSRMLDVPRDIFVPSNLSALAYSDAAFSIGDKGERALLTPMILARLLQEAEIGPQDRILDVAGGNGYTAALVAGLGASVVALEDISEFSAQTRKNSAALGLDNISAVTGPLKEGVSAQAPFDVIIINGVVADGLDLLLAQLAPHGRLLTLMSDAHMGRAVKAVRYDNFGTGCSQRWLFNASGSALRAFAKKPAFRF